MQVITRNIDNNSIYGFLLTFCERIYGYKNILSMISRMLTIFQMQF